MTASQFLELAVSVSLQAALLIALTQALCRVSRRSVVSQCRLWSCCYAALLLIVTAGVLLPHWRALRPWSQLSSDVIVGAAAFEMRLGSMVFTIWLAGMILSSVSFGIRWAMDAQAMRNYRTIPQEQLASDGQPHRDANGRPISFLSTPDLVNPCCWQFHQPYVVLPAWVLQLDARQQNFIIRHEVEHLRLQHPLQVFLQHLVGGVFWFHPMVWWAANQSAVARELACDEAALDSPHDVVGYLRTLLKSVETTSGVGCDASGALAFGAGPGVVAHRARRLLLLAQSGETAIGARAANGKPIGMVTIVAAVLIALTVWLPMDVFASQRSGWSPWPSWSARVLHDLGVTVRDYETFGERSSIHELLEKARESGRDTSVVL